MKAQAQLKPQSADQATSTTTADELMDAHSCDGDGLAASQASAVDVAAVIQQVAGPSPVARRVGGPPRVPSLASPSLPSERHKPPAENPDMALCPQMLPKICGELRPSLRPSSKSTMPPPPKPPDIRGFFNRLAPPSAPQPAPQSAPATAQVSAYDTDALRNAALPAIDTESVPAAYKEPTPQPPSASKPSKVSIRPPAPAALLRASDSDEAAAVEPAAIIGCSEVPANAVGLAEAETMEVEAVEVATGDEAVQEEEGDGSLG